MTKDELRAKISAAEKVNGRRRYGRSLMDAVLEHADPRNVAGESLSRVAGDLGMDAGTLQRWFANRTKRTERVLGPNPAVSGPAAADPLSAMGFVRLEPTTRTVGEPAPLEVLLPGGITVRAPVGFDGVTLSRVLTLVKGGAA